MLLAKQTGYSLSILLPLINLPFIAIGFRHIGIAFAIRSAIAIGLLAGMLAIFNFPDITHDKVLSAVFGGFFIGAGIGFSIRGGAVLDGTDIAALLISKRSHLLRVGDVIMFINVVIFLVAIYVLGVENALYSILTYVTAAKMVDFLIYGLEQYTAITIMSQCSVQIRERIMNELGRGVTVYRAQGGKSGLEREILYCVVTRLEIGSVKEIIRECDEDAFVVTHPLSDVEGGTVKRTQMH